MAAFDISRTTYGSTGIFNSFGKFLADISGSIADWNDARITRKVLSQLSDRELEDIGLIRGDIDRVSVMTNMR